MLSNIEINYIFKKGKRVRLKYISIFFLKKPTVRKEKYAIAVSKKIKSKPQKNKIKRQVKEIIRKSDLPNHYVYVFYIGDEFPKKTFNENKRNIINLLFLLKKLIIS